MTVLFDLHGFVKKEKYLLWVIEVKEILLKLVKSFKLKYPQIS